VILSLVCRGSGLVYSVLPVTLDCPLLIAALTFLSGVISVSGLSILDCRSNVFYSVLPVSLDCPFLIAALTFCIRCYQCLWIVQS
jgi:hypothetical protein